MKKSRIVRTEAGAKKYGVEIGQPIPEKDALGRIVTTLIGGQRLVNVHPSDRCAGEFCTIHNNSNHHMKDWPQNWRPDRHIMERICPHGVGHPDPDDPAMRFEYERVHGCDLCCNPEKWAADELTRMAEEDGFYDPLHKPSPYCRCDYCRDNKNVSGR